MEWLQVLVILVAGACVMGASITPETSTSVVELVSSNKNTEKVTTTTTHESASANESESSANPRRLFNALKNHRVQSKKHIRDKKSVPSDPSVGCITVNEARGAPYLLCEDHSSINTMTTLHTGRNEDAVKVDKEGDGKIDNDGDGTLDKEGEGKWFGGLLPGAGAALHTSVLPNALPGYSGVQAANLGPAYGGVFPGNFGGGYPSSLTGGYAGLYPGYTGCQTSQFYPGSSLLPYNHFVQPLTPIVPTSYFHRPVPSIPIAAPTADVASHLYKHNTNTAASHRGFGQFSAQQANRNPVLSIKSSGSYVPTQFSAKQEAIRNSQINVANPVASQRGLGQFSSQQANRYPTQFPVTQEEIRQYPANVFNSMASYDTSAQFSAQQEAVRSQIGQVNSRTINLNHVDFPALPQINNYLPTMQLPTGQSVRSSGPGFGVFPQSGDANCGGIPLLTSCTPTLMVGKLIENGVGGYGAGLGAHEGGHLNKAYGSFGSGYSAPWFSGSPYGNVYYRESVDDSASSPLPQKEDKVYKKVYTPLEKSAELQKEPTKDEKKSDEKSKTKSSQ